MKFGLGTMRRLCDALGHPERQFRSILVAGTNGKGSVTAMVHQGLVAAGHRAGRYTSPHLERLEERFVVGNRETSRDDLNEAAAVIRTTVESLEAAGDLETSPTFFECATAMAFELFRKAEMEIAVLEVGLGGRLDATNVVEPVAVAITSIDYDHQAQLGSTLEAIAYEKAGVIRPGIPVVCGPLPPGADNVIVQTCREQGARLLRASSWTGLEDLPGAAAPALRGAHQRENARVAGCLLQELDALGVQVDEASRRSGILDVEWPGRLETLRWRGAEVLLDAAHNPAGARALADYLRETGWTPATLVFGALEDKDVRSMLAELAPACGAIVCTTPASPRALQAEVLATLAKGVAGAEWTVSAIPEPERALEFAVGASGQVVAAGSIFLIGRLRGILRAR
ncbi:folylpolyglutamate synthase/dihydrofolate synthase family protein [soil metagenome]